MESGPTAGTDFHGYGASIRERLSQLIPRDRDLNVLDVGTGMASTSTFLLEHLSRKSRIWSLDPSGEVIAQAKKSLLDSKGRRATRVRFVQGTADRMKFEDSTFDLVVSVMVMHHIEALSESFSEMSRVLRYGGRLIIIDYSPDAHSLDFQSRHAEQDFFTAEAISKAAIAAKLTPSRVEELGQWYLVEATKKKKKKKKKKQQKQ